MKMMIDLDFLRWVVFNPHDTLIQPRLHIDPDTPRVSQYLRHLFVQRQHEAWFTAPCSLSHVLQRHDALSNARNAGHDGRASSEIAAIHEFIQTRDACGYSCRRIEGAGEI